MELLLTGYRAQHSTYLRCFKLFISPPAQSLEPDSWKHAIGVMESFAPF